MTATVPFLDQSTAATRATTVAWVDKYHKHPCLLRFVDEKGAQLAEPPIACEQFIRTHSGWFTTTLTLFAVQAILTKVYGVDAVLASHKLAQFAAGPIVVSAVDPPTALTAMHTADMLGIDLPDTVLLQTVQTRGAL